MKTRKCVVIERAGPTPGAERDAAVLICPRCENETFVVFSLDDLPTHLHFQCAACNVTFCDQACMAPEVVRRYRFSPPQ